MATFNDVLEWAKGSTRPLSQCQGFVGNDLIPAFGGTMNRYYDTAREAGDDSTLVGAYPGVPSWAFFTSGTDDHVGFGTPDRVLSDISRNEVILGGPTDNIGTSSLATLIRRGFPFRGWSTTNGRNTMPTLVEKLERRRRNTMTILYTSVAPDGSIWTAAAGNDPYVGGEHNWDEYVYTGAPDDNWARSIKQFGEPITKPWSEFTAMRAAYRAPRPKPATPDEFAAAVKAALAPFITPQTAIDAAIERARA